MKDKKDIIMADSASASSETGKTLLDLPNEILINIAFMFTSPQDILAFFQLNKQISSNAWIWLTLIQRDFGEEALAVFNHQAPDERDLATRANEFYDFTYQAANERIWRELIQRDFGEEALAVFNHQVPDERDFTTRASEFYGFTYQAARELIDNVSVLMGVEANSTLSPFFNRLSNAVIEDLNTLEAWHALPTDQQYKTFHEKQICYQNVITALANNTPDPDGFTILHRAAMNDRTEIVKLLLDDHRINVDIKNKNGSAALALAVLYGHANIVQLLLAAPGIEVDAENEDGRTALMSAAIQGLTDIVQLLLAAPGINVNATSADGNSALMWAAKSGCLEVVKILLKDRRIDVNINNKNGKTALALATEYGREEIVALLKNFAPQHQGGTTAPLMLGNANQDSANRNTHTRCALM